MKIFLVNGNTITSKTSKSFLIPTICLVKCQNPNDNTYHLSIKFLTAWFGIFVYCPVKREVIETLDKVKIKRGK